MRIVTPIEYTILNLKMRKKSEYEKRDKSDKNKSEFDNVLKEECEKKKDNRYRE